MEYLVGYFDVLNMHVDGMNDEVGAGIAEAFLKPLHFTASRHPKLRLEVFADSLVTGCEPAMVGELLTAVCELYRTWCTDYILVKGSVVLGEVDAVSGSFEKILLEKLQKIKMHRLSGPAVIEAFSLAEASAPGMWCLVSPRIGELIRQQHPAFLSEMVPAALNWIDPENIESYEHLFREMLTRQELYLEKLEPHIHATLRFFEQCREKRRI